MRERLGLVAGALATSVSVALAAAVTVVGLGPDRLGGNRFAAVGIAFATVWSCAALVALLLGDRRHDRDGTVRHVELPELDEDEVAAIPAVTTIVRVGEEPAEIARSTVALAARLGPTVVISNDPARVEAMAPLADSVHTDPDLAVALRDAADAAATDAILLVSARAVPDMDTCRRAATLLDDDTGWVSGTTRPFAHDRFVSDRRDVVGAALRRRSVAGLVLWESDATIVRRDLLAEHELGASRSWGSWLRARAAEGVRGCSVTDALSMRAAPVAASSYWPDALSRQRAGAVDLASAAGTGPMSARLDALLLLLRELWAYPTALLAVCVVLVGRHAGGLQLLGLLAALGGAAVLRWAALRIGLGLDLRPRADMTSAVYHLPGSFSALPAAITRRVRPLGRSLGTRPLVWGALVLTIVTGWLFIGAQQAGATSATGARVAAALCLAALGLLWAFAIRSLVERAWQRSSYRVRLRLPATIDGVEVTTVDGSPGGVAVIGRFTTAVPEVGDEVRLEVDLDDDTTMTASGVVADRRSGHGRTQLGIELHSGSDMIGEWSAQLLRAATADERSAGAEPGDVAAAGTVGHDRSRPTRRRGLRVLDRVLTGVVVIGSLFVAAALVLVLLGFRPYVIRSGSMVPTYHVGDIVLVEQVRADQLRPGDVASLDYFAQTGEGLTHRIREIRPLDGDLEFETRGDANETSETWVEPPDAPVGRVVLSIPAIGAIATLARTATVPMVIFIVVLALAVGALLFLRRPDSPDQDGADQDGADQDGAGQDSPDQNGTEEVSADRARDERPAR